MVEEIDSIALEHRLTTLEVTLKQGLDNIVALGISNGEKATAMTFALEGLTARVGVQNGRISKAESAIVGVQAMLGDIAPKVEAMDERGADTNAVVRFIKEAGGIGNGVILLAISVATFIIVYTH